MGFGYLNPTFDTPKCNSEETREQGAGGEREKVWGVWGVWEVWGDRDTKEN